MSEENYFYGKYNVKMANEYGLSVAAVYGYLWTSCCNFDNHCVKASYETIGKYVGLKKKQVYRIIRKLSALGLINISWGNNESNTYVIYDCNQYPCKDNYEDFSY